MLETKLKQEFDNFCKFKCTIIDDLKEAINDAKDPDNNTSDELEHFQDQFDPCTNCIVRSFMDDVIYKDLSWYLQLSKTERI